MSDDREKAPGPTESLTGYDFAAAEAQALAAFHLALPLPRIHDEEHAREWHDKLIGLARALLDLRGVAYQVVQADEGWAQLVISPVEHTSHLNDFAHDVASKLGGIAFVYSPRDLLKPEGNRARASFHREKNRILLPKAFLDHPRIDDAIHHEVLHAVFHDLLRNGLSSLFHGWLRSLDKAKPMWPIPHYRQRMSLEELATHALNLFLISEDLRAALQGAAVSEVEALYRRLRLKAGTLSAIATEAAGVLERALIAMELGPQMRLEHTRLEPGLNGLRPESGTVDILWVRLAFEQLEVKLPLLPPDAAAAERWKSCVAGQSDPEVRAEITSGFRRRLEMQRRVAAEFSAQAGDVLKVLESLGEDWRGGLERLLHDDAFWETLSGPRKLSLQYLRA